MQPSKFKRQFSLFAVILAVALAATGCGGSEQTTDETRDHNDQDVAFAKDMIPHHAQAVEMADLAAASDASAPVKDLATKIKAAQQPEINQMNGWLREWGEKEVDTSDNMHGSHHGMGDNHEMGSAQGMMSQDAMAQLANAKGAEFDRLFLQGMIEHHLGAIEMARAEQQNGQFEPAKNLAKSITASQQFEVDEMRTLLR